MRWREDGILKDARITVIGRCDERDPLRFFWVGSGVTLAARVKALAAVIEADWTTQTPWLSVTLDAAPVTRLPLRRGRHHYLLLDGMDGERPHRIGVVRDTQPMEDDARQLVRLCSLQLAGEILPREERRRIEFIGDSLTSGEGLAGPMKAAEWRSVYMSGGPTYAARVCTLLDAVGEWVSQSGWGVVSDWTGDRRHTLPGIYEEVCALQAEGRIPYDFSAHPVDAVVVNLGTNDMSALNALPVEEREARSAEIVTSVRAFCERIRFLRPGVPILWVCGMCGGGINGLLRQGVETAARALSDSRIAFLPLPACPQEALGSLGHPGPASHRECAALIAAKLKELIENLRGM